ncbi:MAG: hypothetical protein ACYC0B_02020 [Gemmatimonadaceae bacterium]
MTKLINGIAPGPNSPLLAKARGCRDEDAEGELCDDFVLRAPRGSMANFSQKPESMQTRGISDRRYRFYGIAFFYELKAEDGQLTPSQHAFLLDELSSGALAACGTLDDLQAFAALAATGAPHAVLATYCHALVQRWAAKGYRREDLRPRRRRRR